MIATNLDEKFTRIVTKQIAKVVKAEGWTEELKSEIVRIDSKHDFMTVAFNLGYLATAFLILDGKTGYWTYRSENLPYHKIFCDRTLDEAAELMIQDWYDSDFSGLN